MKLILNGDCQELPRETTNVRGLVDHLGLGKFAVAVEVNRQVIPRRHHESTLLNEGDEVEIVSLIGGG